MANYPTCRHILQRCQSNGKLDCALKVVQLMRDSNFRLDSSDFKMLIQHLIHAGQLEEVLRLLQDFMQHGYQPDESTIEMAVEACFAHGAVDQCVRLATACVEYNYRISTSTWTVILNGFIRTKNLETCFELLSTISAKQEADAPWDRFLQSCCELGRADVAVKSLESIQVLTLKPQTHRWRAVLSDLIRFRHLDLALQTLIVIRQNFIPLEDGIVRDLFAQCVQSGLVDPVLNTVRTMIKTLGPTASPSFLCTVITALIKYNQIEKALVVLDQLLDCNETVLLQAHLSGDELASLLKAERRRRLASDLAIDIARAEMISNQKASSPVLTSSPLPARQCEMTQTEMTLLEPPVRKQSLEAPQNKETVICGRLVREDVQKTVAPQLALQQPLFVKGQVKGETPEEEDSYVVL
eukprot:GILK01004869.1.p1 GENE.GILK01004869.1~~GILK01004869.1.p1  ORF type:complete len:475 (+),score=94.92 GILK01004869.1:193-1425(+)